MKKFTLLASALMMAGAASAHFTCWNSALSTSTGDYLDIAIKTNTAGTEYNDKGLAVIGGETPLTEDNRAGVDPFDTGHYGVTFDGINHNNNKEVAYLRFRYNVNDGKIHWVKNKVPRLVDECTLHILVGPKPEGATSDVITPLVLLTSNVDKNGSNTEYTCTYTFEPITLTDEVQEVTLTTKNISGKYHTNDYKDPTSGADLTQHYIDVRFNDIQKGQWISLLEWGFSKYHRPVATFDKESRWEFPMSGEREKWLEYENKPGTLYIQAEDYIPFFLNDGVPAHNDIHGIDMFGNTPDAYAGRNGNLSMWFEPDGANVGLHNSGSFCAGMQLWRAWGEGHSAVHDNSQGFALLGMAQSMEDAGTRYCGEYLDETSNKISMEQALNGFGSWVEYDFEMAEDGFIDLSISACAHINHMFNSVIGGGTKAVVDEEGNPTYVTRYKQDRENFGYEVEGLDDDFLKLYGFAYQVEVDGNLQRTNWDVRPMPSSRNGQLANTLVMDPTRWSNYQETLEDGSKVNSTFLYILPNYHASFGQPGDAWWPRYRDQFVKMCYDNEVATGEVDEEGKDIMGPSVFKTKVDAMENGQEYLASMCRPDYKDIPVSKGIHKIRVRSTGGGTVFDEMRLNAHQYDSNGNVNGVENVKVAEEAVVNAPAEYFDLQGRRVMNPENGLFIVKRGNKVTKEVIR